MTDWQAKIAEMVAIKRAIVDVDTEKLWPLSLPAPGATEENVRRVEAILGYPIDASYRSFLLHANGWPRFKTMDLFGADDLVGGQRKALARELLGYLEENELLANGDCPWDIDWTGETYGGSLPAERSLLLLSNLLPIGVSDNGGLVFALRAKSPWPIYRFSGGHLVDRYPTFEAFFDAAIGYSRAQYERMRNGSTY